MIKTIHEIKLRDILLLDETKRATHLLRYSWIPFFLVRERLEILVQDIFQKLGTNTIESIQEEFDKLIAYRKILLLQALHGVIIGELKLKTKINAWKIIDGVEPMESKDLDTVLAEIEKHTGIKITDDNGVVKFEKHIELRCDKFKEVFPEKKQEEKADIGEVLYSIFNFMEEPYNIDMRLMDFLSMKKVAEDKAIKLKTQEHGK